ncbi:hypothetical protein C8J57DRAFT_1435421 [Mycena rebaudengoi]|nr:hypothetical protein C8J57DRAFT_1435421 [Mycena rebaudengoi]
MPSFSLRPVNDLSPSPSPSQSSPAAATPPYKPDPGAVNPARSRRPLSPSSLRDVDLTHTADMPLRRYPAPPTGHDLMALFPPPAPDNFANEMRPTPTSTYFQRQERAFFAQAGKEIVRVRVDIDHPDVDMQHLAPNPKRASLGLLASSAASSPATRYPAQQMYPPPPQSAGGSASGSRQGAGPRTPVFPPTPHPSSAQGPHLPHPSSHPARRDTDPASAHPSPHPSHSAHPHPHRTDSSSSAAHPMPPHRSDSSSSAHPHPHRADSHPMPHRADSSPHHAHAPHRTDSSPHAHAPHRTDSSPHAHAPHRADSSPHAHAHPPHRSDSNSSAHPHPHRSDSSSSALSHADGAGDDYRADDPDEAWRRPMPYNERRRAGKHTKRVVVRT